MQDVYIIRDDDGQVCGLSASAVEGAEHADLESAEVRDFLRSLDVDLVRVLEDVIELLVARGVFRFTDLPQSAQDKLLFRKNLRSQWNSVPDPVGIDDNSLF